LYAPSPLSAAPNYNYSTAYPRLSTCMATIVTLISGAKT